MEDVFDVEHFDEYERGGEHGGGQQEAEGADEDAQDDLGEHDEGGGQIDGHFLDEWGEEVPSRSWTRT